MSRVRVELDVITRDERVDMEADITRITTTLMIMSGSVESMAGMILSYTGVPEAVYSMLSP